jgi:ribosome modulation factor
MLYIILFVGACIVVGLWLRHATKREADRQQKIRDLAIAQGSKATVEGKAESECPYDHVGSDPGNVPLAGLIVFTSEPPFKGPRFWWLAGYRNELKRPRAQ